MAKVFKQENGKKVELTKGELEQRKKDYDASVISTLAILKKSVMGEAEIMVEKLASASLCVDLMRTDPDNEIFSQVDAIRAKAAKVIARLEKMPHEERVEFDYLKALS